MQVPTHSGTQSGYRTTYPNDSTWLCRLCESSELCDQILLEKYLLGAIKTETSFNSLIWARAPKPEYATRSTIEVAIRRAELFFNSIQQAHLPILERLGVAPVHICTEYLANRISMRSRGHSKDKHGIKRAVFCEKTLAKKRRISK